MELAGSMPALCHGFGISAMAMGFLPRCHISRGCVSGRVRPLSPGDEIGHRIDVMHSVPGLKESS
jgi:hypothetical protein